MIEGRPAERLNDELILWMTTVTPKGQPQTSPVWFLWDGETFLVYSLDNTARVRNIEGNTRVSVNLDGDGMGSDIVTIEATAAIDRSLPPASDVPEYLTKYAERLEHHRWTPERFSEMYPVPIRVTPTRVRA